MTSPSPSPGLDPGAVAALRDCLRSLLDPAGRTWAPPRGTSPAEMAVAVRRHRCEAFLARRRDRLPTDLAAAATARLDQTRTARLLQIAETTRLVQALSAAGVPVLAIKGPSLAVQTDGDAGARSVGDVDLFIDPTTVARVHGLLTSSAYAPPSRAPVPGTGWAWEHLLDAYYELPFTSPVGEVDLHWRLDPAVGALPTFATAWERREQLELAGHPVATLSVRDAFQHACSNAARDDWRWLRSLVDVHLLAGREDLWRALPVDALRRVDLTTLTVTRELIGLPDAVPGAVHARLTRPRARAVACARRWQEREHPWVRARHVPGAEWPTQLRRHLRSVDTVTDALRVTRGIVVLPLDTGGVRARSAWTGVPLALAQRLQHAGHVVRHGRPEHG